MAQRAQIIDITKSYLPGDPNAYVQSLVNTDREDGEEKTLPVLPYEGYNFLPTSYGYKSYFGTNSSLNIEALASRAQFILSYQRPNYKTSLIALCEDGIWTCNANTADSAWIHEIVFDLTTPPLYDPGIYEEWTWCVIENTLYMYQQGRATAWKTSGEEIVSAAASVITFTAVLEGIGGAGYFYDGMGTCNFWIAGIGDDGEIGAISAMHSVTPSGADYDTVRLSFTEDPNSKSYRIYMYEPDYGGNYLAVKDMLYNTGQSGILFDLSYIYKRHLVATSTTAPSDTLNWVTPTAAGLTLSSIAAGAGVGIAGTYSISLAVQKTITGIDYITRPTVAQTIEILGSTNIQGTITNNTGALVKVIVLVQDVTTGIVTEYYFGNLADGASFTNVTLTTNTNYKGLYGRMPVAVADPAHIAIATHTPTFLNMAGQMGIFKAGLRLGFWDSANSVSWSSNLDLTDFTPAIETLAGNTIFGDIVGRIVTVKSHGEGFIVYATKSIVGVAFTATGNILWDGKKILDNSGIANSRAVTVGKTDAEHFVFGTTGIYTIGGFNALAGKYEAAPILPELYDFLRESRDPIYLTTLQDRYLCFSLVDAGYIYGFVSAQQSNLNPLQINIPLSDGYTDDYFQGDFEGDSRGALFALPAIMDGYTFYTIFDCFAFNNFSTKHAREWVPRWDITFDQMLTTVDTHLLDGPLHYEFGLPITGPQFDQPAWSSPRNLVEADFTAETPVEGAETGESVIHYGTQYTVTDCRPGDYYFGRPTEFSDIGLFYSQHLEWQEFQIRQAATKDAIIGWGTLSNTAAYTNGQVLGELLSGKGPTKVLFDKGRITMRKYFTEVYEVSAVVGAASVAESYFNYNTAQVTAFMGYYNNLTYNPNPLPIVNQYNVALRNLTGDSVSISQINTSMSVQDVLNLLPAFFSANHSYYLLQIVIGTIEAIPAVVTYYRNVTTNALVYTFPNRTSGEFNYFLPVSVPVLAPYVANFSYAATPVSGTYGYSEISAIQTYWDLLDLVAPYPIVASIPFNRMTRRLFDNLYPDTSGIDPSVLNSYWFMVDANGNIRKGLSPINTYTGYFGQNQIDGGYTYTTQPTNTGGYILEGVTHPPVVLSVTYPGATFVLQTGSIEAVYPDFVGALVLDLQLKKWGKYKGDHKLLIELVPLNSSELGSFSHTDLGVDSGILNSSGVIYIFDSIPADSWLRYGKIGYYRQGMSDIVEVKVQFRKLATGTIVIDSSLDGKTLNPATSTSEIITAAYEYTALPDISARWHTVKISGNYDLTGLEVRATIAGRR